MINRRKRRGFTQRDTHSLPIFFRNEKKRQVASVRLHALKFSVRRVEPIWFDMSKF